MDWAKLMVAVKVVVSNQDYLRNATVRGKIGVEVKITVGGKVPVWIKDKITLKVRVKFILLLLLT